jgi:hypothetical protein
MQRRLTLITTLLLVATLFVAMAAGVASAAPASSILATIQLDKDVEVTPGMQAHLMYISISDETWGGSYAQDPSAVIYPILSYTYENHGTVPQNGHLNVRFVDDLGQSYEGKDDGTMDTIAPGKTSSTRTIEINIPKERKLTGLVVIMGFEEVTYPIDYPDLQTPTATPEPGEASSASPTGTVCIGAMLLPLVLVGTVWIGKRMARK